MHVLAGEELYRVRQCVHGGGQSILWPFHDVQGAGELLSGLRRPDRTIYDILKGFVVFAVRCNVGWLDDKIT